MVGVKESTSVTSVIEAWPLVRSKEQAPAVARYEPATSVRTEPWLPKKRAQASA